MSRMKLIHYLVLLCIVIVPLFLQGCGPSYPKEKIAESLQKMLKREYNIESTVELKGSTLFLDVALSGLTATEVKTLTEVLKTVQQAMLSITRVALSSDANIEFMVVRVTDPTWKLGLRLIQRLEDVKNLLYSRISRSDYEGRLVLEIHMGAHPENEISQDKTPITNEEFIGRLVVSQINAMNRGNPFLSVLLNNSNLKYKNFTENELIVDMSSNLGKSTFVLFKGMLLEKAAEVFKKYPAWRPQYIKVLNSDEVVATLDINEKK